MERCIAQQYLARIGYISSAEQHIPETDPNPRPDIRLATIEEVQAKILNQLKEQHAAQRPAPATISIRPATQTRTPDFRAEAALSSILPDTPSIISATGTEAQHRTLGPSHKHESPTPPTKVEILARLYSELERRQNTCLEIERQIETCRKQIRTHPSKQRKIEKEHEKPIAEFVKPEHNEKQKKIDTEKRKDAKTAEEVEFEEMRNIYLQYDREIIGVPTAESVDALFVVVANTEHQIKKAEEAKEIAVRREVKLEERLYEARCAMFEMEDEIEEVENGGLAKEAREPKVEDSRFEGYKEGKGKGKGKPRRRKGAKDRQQGTREGGEKKLGRRRKRRRNISSKTGKMSSDTFALDG